MTDYIKGYTDKRAPYHGEAVRLVEGFQEPNHTIDAHGVMRWNSNGRVPPKDVCELAVHVGLPVDLAACDTERKIDTDAAIDAYIKAQRDQPISAEIRANARAAHGPGVTLVDVISGRRFTT